jgi:hypothetical protein
MVTDTVNLYNEMDTSIMTISPPIPGKQKGVINMYIGGPNRQPFRFQLTDSSPSSRSRVVFSPDENPTGTKVNLCLTINKACEEAIGEFWGSIDDRVIKHVAANSKEFLKKKMSETEVRKIFKPCIRRKEGYEPYIKARFQSGDVGNLPVLAFEADESLSKAYSISPRDIGIGDSVICVVQPGLIFHCQGSVGYTVDITHIVRYKTASISSFPFKFADDSSKYASPKTTCGANPKRKRFLSAERRHPPVQNASKHLWFQATVLQ